jgi:hypothetical protein
LGLGPPLSDVILGLFVEYLLSGKARRSSNARVPEFSPRDMYPVGQRKLEESPQYFGLAISVFDKMMNKAKLKATA